MIKNCEICGKEIFGIRVKKYCEGCNSDIILLKFYLYRVLHPDKFNQKKHDNLSKRN